MTYAQKYGFRFAPAPPDSPVVRAYVAKHLMDNGYPLDVTPAATRWAAVIRSDGEVERVYGVFGWRAHPRSIEVTDFYLYPDRWGVLAGYAAIERIKADADRECVELLTATPAGNKQMIAAYKRIFGVPEPALVVYRYVPATAAKPAADLVEVA